ncbi:MAG: 4-hydroxy-tetrahydrodipicolinate synthase [Peptostreptococcaceae bacterium]
MFKGSGVALVTPFNENGINFDALEKLVDFHLENSTDALIICGTTGESTTMNCEEVLSTLEFVVKKVNKKIPVIAGTGSNNTQKTIKLSQRAKEIGVDGLLIITPYYNKCSQKGLVLHFEEIAKNIDLPIILYNVPSRTNVNIAPSVVAELSKIKNIVGIKEASGDLAQVLEIKRLVDEDFFIYSGNDDSIVPLLSVGGHGVISVVANVCPKETHDMIFNYLEGNTSEALKIQMDLKPLIDSLFIEVNPIPVKTAMNLLGFNCGNLRLPLCEMEESNLEILKKELLNRGLTLC